MENTIKLFEDRRIRYAWDAEREEWFFSATDGKSYKTDCFSTKDTLRLIQSIPSPKAEPFKIPPARIF